MIFPYGQERNSVRLLPWVTIIIVLLNFIIHWNITSKNEKVTIELNKIGFKALKYWRTHPYLEITKMFSNDQINLKNSGQIKKAIEMFRDKYEKEIPSEELVREEQKLLDIYIAEFNDTKVKLPVLKYGFTPVKKNFINSITYMFIHGGWIHLLSNLFLLYLVGPYIEDVWGKPMYAIAYLAIGALSAFAFAAHYPDMAGPLIGASGAISGILGAFLVRFWNAKIKFFYWFWFIFGTFKAPAWLMIPLWFGNEILTAKQMDSLYTNGSGVAHWAHVWGFVFGVLIAFAISYFKFEQKVVNKNYNEKYTFTNKGFLDYEEAVKLKEAGKVDEAFALLFESAKNDFKNTDVIELLWVTAEQLERIDEVKAIFIKHIEYELRTDRLEAAQFHYNKLISLYPATELNVQLSLILIQYLIEIDFNKDALQLSNSIYQRTKNESLAGFLIPFSAVLLRLDSKHFEEIVKRTISNLEVPAINKEGLKKDLADYLKNTKNKTSGIETKNMAIIRAVPVSVNKEKIVLNIKDKGKTTLLLNKIKYISVVKIMSYNSRTIFLIDLFLNEMSDENMRIIRTFSIDFDPMKFIPNAKNAGDAFKTFVMALLKYSGANPFYDMDYLILRKVKSFESIEEYDKSLNT